MANKFSDHVIVDKNSGRNFAGDILRFHDFVKLLQLQKQKGDDHQESVKYDSVKDVARLKDFLGMGQHEKERVNPEDIGSAHVKVHDEEEMAKGNVKHSSNIADLPKDAPAIGSEHNPPDEIVRKHAAQQIKAKTLTPSTNDHFKQDSYTPPQGQDLDLDNVIDSTEGSDTPIEVPKYGHTMDGQGENTRRRKINYRVHENKLMERQGSATYDTERPLGAEEGEYRNHPSNFISFSDDFDSGVDAVEKQLNAAAQLQTVDPLVRQATLFTPQADLKTFELPKPSKSAKSTGSSKPLMQSNVDIFDTFDDLLSEDVPASTQSSEYITHNTSKKIFDYTQNPLIDWDNSAPNLKRFYHARYNGNPDFNYQKSISKLKISEPLTKPLAQHVQDLLKIHPNINIGESKEIQDNEDDLNKLADAVKDEHDILHLYEPDELSLVDPETNTAQCLGEDHQLDEVLSRTERIKVGMRFARSETKRERKLQIALKRHSDPKTLNRRARQLAIRMLKERLVHRPSAELSIAEKERVEQMLAQRKGMVDKLALKLVPKIKKIERERLTHPAVTKGH